jgi:hypothetical protein
MKNLLFLIALIFISCGARKVEKSVVKESLTTEQSDNSILIKTEDLNLKKSESTKVDYKNETVTKETVYEPIDPTKSATVINGDGTRTDLNNSKKTTRETTQKNNIKTDQSKNTVQDAKIVTSDKKDVKQKTNTKKVAEVVQIDRKQFNLWNSLWILLLVPIYFIWKNRSVILDKIKSFWWV